MSWKPLESAKKESDREKKGFISVIYLSGFIVQRFANKYNNKISEKDAIFVFKLLTYLIDQILILNFPIWIYSFNITQKKMKDIEKFARL